MKEKLQNIQSIILENATGSNEFSSICVTIANQPVVNFSINGDFKIYSKILQKEDFEEIIKNVEDYIDIVHEDRELYWGDINRPDGLKDDMQIQFIFRIFTEDRIFDYNGVYQKPKEFDKFFEKIAKILEKYID